MGHGRSLCRLLRPLSMPPCRLASRLSRLTHCYLGLQSYATIYGTIFSARVGCCRRHQARWCAAHQTALD